MGTPVRSAAAALALLGVVLTGCTQQSSAPAPERAEGGLESWRPPEGAPTFCAALAGAEHLDTIPSAVGRLVADPGDTRQAWRLTQSTGDLRDVREEVREDGRHAELEAALDELIDALVLASSGPVDRRTGERIGAGLRAVGSYVQPVCEFPA